MGPEQFDDIARQFAAAAARPGSRRGFLRVLGLGGVAIAAGPETTSAAPTPKTADGQRRLQVTQEAEIDDLAFELEYDVEKIFAFVRDEVAYDPYAGVLRGAKGTLWGLAGNAADQAILLAALLNAAMIKTRFVIGELRDDAAQRLLGAALMTKEETIRHAAKVIMPPAPTDEQVTELTPEDEEFIQGLSGLAERFQDRVDQRTADGTGIVLDSLAEAGFSLPELVTVMPELERRQHTWVQYAMGTDWVDLDPSMVDAKPGDVFAAPGEPTEGLPEEHFHLVTFRLMAEQIAGGAPSKVELLSHSAPSADFVGVPLNVFHPQAAALKAIGQTITGEIGGYRNFMTTLVVGEEVISGKPVTFGTGDGIFDVVDESATVDGDTIAEWLEIEIRTPAGTRQIVRELFDRVGFAERERGPIDVAAIRPLELVDAGDPELSFLPLAGMWSLGVITGAVPASTFRKPMPAEPTTADLLNIAHSYHYARDVFSLGDRFIPSFRTFCDEPNLTAFVMRPSSVEEGVQVANAGLDLLHRSVAFASVSTGPANGHPLVAAGVLTHAIEQAMIETAAEEPISLPAQAIASVGRVFEAAKGEGMRTLVLHPEDASPDYPAVSDAARLRIERALKAGYVVIVPERAVMLGEQERSGWWLVNPATGETLDQMDDGTGSCEMCQYIFKVLKLGICGAMAIALMGAAVFLTLAVAQIITSDTPGLDAGAVAGIQNAAAQNARNGSRSGATGAVAGAACVV